MIRTSRRSFAREGTILIIIAGISALLASLALTFLARNRADVRETASTVQHVQARIMLVAAMNYIQECSRMGWDRYPKYGGAVDALHPTQKNDIFPLGGGGSDVPIHEETFGWIDVRDGAIGPITQEGRVCWSPTPKISDGISLRPEWPAPNSIVRCPMYVWKQPPYATQLTACYNPINTDPSAGDYLMPYLKNPDPQPFAATNQNGTYSASELATEWAKHVDGDPNPQVQTTNKSWFRILREGPCTFLITCGSGGTLGFRSYKEADDQGHPELFNHDPAYFASLAGEEVRLWYRVEWSAASAEGTYHWILHHSQSSNDTYLQWPLNASHSWSYGCRSPAFDRNMGGTFRWHMRLRKEPTFW